MLSFPIGMLEYNQLSLRYFSCYWFSLSALLPYRSSVWIGAFCKDVLHHWITRIEAKFLVIDLPSKDKINWLFCCVLKLVFRGDGRLQRAVLQPLLIWNASAKCLVCTVPKALKRCVRRCLKGDYSLSSLVFVAFICKDMVVLPDFRRLV